MRTDEYRFVACGNCVPVCPVGAIYIDPVKNRAMVNQDGASSTRRAITG